MTCPKCGERMKLGGVDIKGTALYVCDDCGKVIEIPSRDDQ